MVEQDTYEGLICNDDWRPLGNVAASIVDQLKQAPEKAAERGKRPAEVSGGNRPEGLSARNVGCARSSVALASELSGELSALPEPPRDGAAVARFNPHFDPVERTGNSPRISVALASEMVGRDVFRVPSSPRPILPGAEAAARRGTGANFSDAHSRETVGRAAQAAAPLSERSIADVAAQRREGSECGFSCAVSRADGVAQVRSRVKGDAIIGLRQRGMAGADVRRDSNALAGLPRLGVDLQQRGCREAELLGDGVDRLDEHRSDDSGRVIFADRAANGGRGRAGLAGDRQQALDIGLREIVLLCCLRGADRNGVFENRSQLVEIDGHLFYLQLCGASGRHSICGGQHAKPSVSHSASSFAKHTPRFFVAIDEFEPEIADALFRHVREHPGRASDALLLFVTSHDTRSSRPETRTSATTLAMEKAADMRMRNCVIAV